MERQARATGEICCYGSDTESSLAEISLSRMRSRSVIAPPPTTAIPCLVVGWFTSDQWFLLDRGGQWRDHHQSLTLSLSLYLADGTYPILYQATNSLMTIISLRSHTCRCCRGFYPLNKSITHNRISSKSSNFYLFNINALHSYSQFINVEIESAVFREIVQEHLTN